MAMTKKERAEFDEAIDKLRIVSALRWTAPIEPDVPPPKSFDGLTIGYLPAGDRVTEACSSSIGHGRDHVKTRSQGARSLYSTRRMALAALRHEVEMDCARRLADIDRQIEMA